MTGKRKTTGFLTKQLIMGTSRFHTSHTCSSAKHVKIFTVRLTCREQVEAEKLCKFQEIYGFVDMLGITAFLHQNENLDFNSIEPSFPFLSKAA